MSQRLAAVWIVGAPFLAACAASPAPPVTDSMIGTTRYISKINTGICPTPGTTQLHCDSIPIGEPVRVLAANRSLASGLTDYQIEYKGRVGFMSATVLAFDTISEGERQSQIATKRECDRRGGVAVGMTAKQVLASCWGKPERINTTILSSSRREQWVYGSQYVYVDNGIVTAIQTSR